MPSPLRIVQYGLGPIGQATARTILEKNSSHVQLVGAIDIAPDKAGRDVAELLGWSKPTGVSVEPDAERVLDEHNPDIVLHTTTSFLDDVTDQLVQCAESGAHVVSSTEELAFPYDRHPERADRLDAVAREHGIVIVGTGVNPGYAMDTLALTATGSCTNVDRVRVERIVDAAERRKPLQEKIGAGISRESFEEKKQTGTFGHIGLEESLRLLADGLDWSLEEVEETLQPVMAETNVETPYLTVDAGRVAGIHQTAVGRIENSTVLELTLKMYVGADASRDAVTVDGDPPIHLAVENGIFGDTATVGMLVNTAPLAGRVAPGLHTMTDLPVPRAFATQP